MTLRYEGGGRGVGELVLDLERGYGARRGQSQNMYFTFLSTGACSTIKHGLPISDLVSNESTRNAKWTRRGGRYSGNAAQYPTDTAVKWRVHSVHA